MAKKKSTVDNDIIDIDLSEIKKQRYRIDGDNNRILELNVQDMNMPSRFFETQKEMEQITNEWAEKISSWGDDLDDEINQQIADDIKNLDKELRAKLDYIFDTNISEITAPHGSMFDFIHGMFRFEYILDTISKLYNDTIANETKLMLNNMAKYTSKYQKKK